MPTPSFGIVMPVYQAKAYLPRVLPALEAAAKRAGADIVAVDNGSTDGSYELLLERRGLGFQVLRLPDLTISALRNRGAAATSASILAFIDADCLVEPDYLERAAAVLRSTGAAATGSGYDLPSDPGWIESAWHALHRRPGDGWVNYVPAGNFVVEREAFDAVHGFDEGLATGEDTELCQRLADSGYRIYASSAVSARHLGNPRTVTAFFRKQYWHALGMFGTFRRDRRDKPVWLTLLHLFASVGAVVLVAVGGRAGLVPAFLLTQLAPAIAVVFRWSRLGRVVLPARSFALYNLYLWARVAALGRAMWEVVGRVKGAPTIGRG